MTRTINQKRQPLCMSNRYFFCLGVARVEIKEDETIKGKCFPVFGCTGKKIVAMDACKK